MTIAGCRPSAFAHIKVGGKKDGTITVWESESWASGGVGGGGSPPIPYVFTRIPNRRLNHKAVSTNNAPIRAWRAPNHQQASYLTCAAIEDFAHTIGMDPFEVFLKNAALTPRQEVYERQLKKAAELAGWKKLWHKRGESGAGPVKRGLGIGICTWGGAGHACTSRLSIHPDGSVEVEQATQDLGTGTRTVMAQTAAETLGLPLAAVEVKIGDTSYPPGNTSGGSTTVGGVSSATRKAAVNALEKLFAAVAFAELEPGRAGCGGWQDHGERPARQGSDLEGRLSEARRQFHRRTGRQRSSAGRQGGPEHRRRRRRANRRRERGCGNRRRQDEPADRRSGLRSHHQSEDGREPGLRRLHHEHLRGPDGGAHHGRRDRPDAERRHGVLQAGWNQGHRRDRRPPGNRRGQRFARRDRAGRTAGRRRHRRHRQCRYKRHRRAAAADSDDPDERSQRPRRQGRIS